MLSRCKSVYRLLNCNLYHWRGLNTLARLPLATVLQKPEAYTNDNLCLAGYVKSIRRHKRFAFLSLNDGTCLDSVQVIIDRALIDDAAANASLDGLATGAAVTIQGQWLAATGNRQQQHELHALNIKREGENDATNNPLQKKFQTADFLRTIPHIRARTSHNALLLRLRSQIILHVTNWFTAQDFFQTHPPIITSSDCEGAGEVFTVNADDSSKQRNAPFFGGQKFLTVSSQLHLEALAQAIGNVWALSPTFRAEKSDTSRHLSEFYMLEAEVSFTRSLEDIMNVLEHLLSDLARFLQQSEVGKQLLKSADSTRPEEDDASQIEAKQLQSRWESLSNAPWPRIAFKEACQRLKQASEEGDAHFKVKADALNGLQTEHERYLAEKIFRGPVFVTHYPATLKPFYMAESAGFDTDTVENFDLLVPQICELAGGSLREHRYDPLKALMTEKGLLSSKVSEADAEHSMSLDWYLDLRRFGSVPHGGFGLGFDRLLSFLSGVENVRDVVTFPRHYNRCLC